MIPNPSLGVLFHWLGGLASASFYVPYRGVKSWAWETYWLVGGFFSWIIVPWFLAFIMTRDLIHVLQQAPGSSLFWSYLFGVFVGTRRPDVWTHDALPRHVSGYGSRSRLHGCLLEPSFPDLQRRIRFGSSSEPHSGLIILGGVVVCLAGIAVAGLAGISKEREMSEEQKRSAIKEFNLKKGLLVATFSGVMSACFAFGLAAGDPIKEITISHGTPPLWQGLPVLVVVLAGGFTTNFVWCVLLNIRNRTGYQYFQSAIRNDLPNRNHEPILENVMDAPAEEMTVAVAVARDRTARVPMLANYLFSALAGTNVVHAVLLLHHGRNTNGEVQVLQLDSPYGEHHDFQYSLGIRIA